MWLLLLVASSAGAHTLPVSFLTLAPDADFLHLELSFNPFELTFFSELDLNKDGQVDAEEWEARQRQATDQILNCLKLRVAGKPITAQVAAVSPEFDTHHATLRAHYAVDARQGPITIESTLATLTSGSHFTQVTFGRGTSAQSARLDPQSAAVTFGAFSEIENSSPVEESKVSRTTPALHSAISSASLHHSGSQSRITSLRSAFSLSIAFVPVLALLVMAAVSAGKVLWRSGKNKQPEGTS